MWECDVCGAGTPDECRKRHAAANMEPLMPEKIEPKRKATSVKLSDLLATIKGHDWRRDCGACKKDCGRIALVNLVYRHERCSCDVAPYVHLVETIYHARCLGLSEESR